jgi:hypothetical protein
MKCADTLLLVPVSCGLQLASRRAMVSVNVSRIKISGHGAETDHRYIAIFSKMNNPKND